MKPTYRWAVLAFCCIGVTAAGVTTAVAAADGAAAKAKSSVTESAFGTLPDGTRVEQFTLRNSSGMEVGVLDYGGIIRSIRVADRHGKFSDVVLGYDSMGGYARNPAYFGALVGRYANRIAKAQFALDGKTYTLAANNAPNTLHGGLKGFDKAVWHAETFEKKSGVGVVLTHTSPDGEEGYPGNLKMRVTYTLSDANELSLEYSATTDKTTVVNLTHHDYFNLGGEGSGAVLGTLLRINAHRYTPVDATMVPTGVLANVVGTPFDFTKLTPIGARIEADDAQLKLGAGYDHNFVIDRGDSAANTEQLSLAARVEEPQSGRVLEVRTTEPGVQFYSANHLDVKGKAGHVYKARDAFCLETEHFPDSPNKPEFPTTTLQPGEMFYSRTVYAFSAR